MDAHHDGRRRVPCHDGDPCSSTSLVARGLFWIALVTIAGTTTSVYASNLQFLRDAPVAKMTPEDAELFRANLNATLEQNTDGVARQWRNPKTNAGGSATPLSTYEREGRKCRKVEFKNTVGGATGHAVVDLCRQADGVWVRPAEPSTPSKSEKTR